uniref:Uncharacterized protein n=2 Tax=unclassified Caudoviricetes TaxID=2788787 RepID=A0A8S5QMX8_9CAUD|nr:MAG TPA: hypothetical protein [Siphoviridae sp. ctV7t52]DAF86127.1 MAG TPA: hypothetical protein [Siphoviridae sp. ctnX725]
MVGVKFVERKNFKTPGRKKSKKSSAREPVGGVDCLNIYQKNEGGGG